MILSALAVVDVALFWWAEVGKAGCKGVSILSGDAPDAFGFQYWSNPKIGPEFNDGGLEKLIPEKSYEFDDVGMPAVLLSPSPAQAYKSKGGVEFRKFVIGETGLWDCALCGKAGYWKVDKPVSVEGVVWNCGLVKVVGACEPMSTDGFSVVGWHCKLAMSLTFNGFADMDCSCGLATVVELIWFAVMDCSCWLATVVELIGFVWISGFAIEVTVGEVWGCGDWKPTSAKGLVTVVELTVAVWFCVFTTKGSLGEVWGCGPGIVAGFGVVLETEGRAQSDARLCRSSIARLPISFMYMI